LGRAAGDSEPTAAAAFALAISELRELSTAYRLAHGCSTTPNTSPVSGDHAAAETAISEAYDIAQRLRCQPLLDLAAGLTREGPRIQA
jgi:hypothetical protein